MRTVPFVSLLALAAALPAFGNTVVPGDVAGWSCTGSCGVMAAQGDITASPVAGPGYAFVSTSGSAATGVSPLALDPNSRGNGIETNGSVFRSASFTALAGDRLDMQFNYASTDGKGYDDYAWARLLNATDGTLVAWLFTARSSNSGTKNIVPGDVVDKSEFDPREVIVNYDDYDFSTRDAPNPIDWAPLGFSNHSCWDDNAAGCGFTGWLQSRHSFVAGGSYRVEVGVVNWGDAAFDSGLAFDFAGAVTAVPEPTPLALWSAGLGLFVFLARRRLGAR